MPLELSANFAFNLARASDALLQFEAAPMADQRIVEGHASFIGCDSVTRVPADQAIGERIWVHGHGRIEVSYNAKIAIDRSVPPLAALSALAPHRLPGSTVPYLLDSRYCHPSQFIDFVEGQFGSIAGGGARLAAIREWVASHIAYAPGASNSATTATDTFHIGQGICRDFAHLFVTLTRACAIPARYVACFAPGVTPQDFHAVAQVYLCDPASPTAGKWYLVDPTGMADLSQAAIIGVGRDAGDVSFLTSFGPMEFLYSDVSVKPPESPREHGHGHPAIAAHEQIS